jgi:hypothetical protein
MTPDLITPPTATEPETRDKLSPVAGTFESLDVEQTNKAYSKLNSTLEGLADTVACTLEQMAPYLAKMQALLSQRGSERKKVLKKAGLPSWSKWIRAYCSKLDCSFRTIQRHIAQKEGRGGQSATSQSAQKKSQRPGTRAKLGGRQQTTSASAEPDWKNVLSQLVSKLEQVGDRLPVALFAELRTVQQLLQAHAESRARNDVDAGGSKEIANRGYIVEERPVPNAAGVQYAVIQRAGKKLYSSYGNRGEADEICRQLNTAPVFSLRDCEGAIPKAS